MISGFRREVATKCALLGYYAASSGKFLPTFRDNFSVLFSGVKNNQEERIFQAYIARNKKCSRRVQAARKTGLSHAFWEMRTKVLVQSCILTMNMKGLYLS
jgi:hypothetical protein